MDAIHVIKKPLITEKHTWHSGEANRYGFLVDRTASKTEIKQAIEELYNVRVTGVATQVRKGGTKRTKYGIVKAKPEKHAVVKVHEEDRIELF
jgi:large subunit ribosomal protein L23